MWRVIRMATGVCLILLGVIGTLVPVVPGIPIVLAGIALVGTDHPWIRRTRARWWPAPADRNAARPSASHAPAGNRTKI